MAAKPGLLRSSIVVGFFSLLGSLTGILVETSIAARLGLSRSSDTFYVAFTVPFIICSLMNATGQFSLVPFFATLEARHSANELWRGFSYCVNLIFLGLGALAAVGAAAAPWLMRGIAPGLTRPQIDLATQLSEWLFLMIVPAGVAEAFRSFLLSQGRFALASAAGLFRNITVILLVLLTFDRYGSYSLVLGYLGGYFLQVLILGSQILVCFPVRYSLTLVGSGEAFRNLRGGGAAQLTSAVTWQIVVLVERIIASFLPPGTLTALNYGFKILGSLTDLFAGSVGTAALAPLSSAVALKAEDAARKSFQAILKISLVLISPTTVFCLLLSRNIIRLMFERGNFTAAATQFLAMVLYYYTLCLPLFSCIRLLTFYLFARQETSWLIRLYIFHYSLVIGFDLVYVAGLRAGAKGIPLGLLTSLLVTLGLAFRRDLGGLRGILDLPLRAFAAKVLLGSLLAGLAIWVLRAWLKPPISGFDNFLYLCELCGVGSFLFFGVLAASRALNLERAWNVLQSAE